MLCKQNRSELAALFAAILVLIGVSLSIVACGDDDLFFPAELPPTQTEEPTATPDDEDDDDF